MTIFQIEFSTDGGFSSPAALCRLNRFMVNRLPVIMPSMAARAAMSQKDPVRGTYRRKKFSLHCSWNLLEQLLRQTSKHSWGRKKTTVPSQMTSHPATPMNRYQCVGCFLSSGRERASALACSAASSSHEARLGCAVKYDISFIIRPISVNRVSM